MEGIGHMADAVSRPSHHDAEVEIRLILETTEPPEGLLRVVPEVGQPPRRGEDQGVRFVGWLGLLSALYAATEAE
jgi:hypothetical protein